MSRINKDLKKQIDEITEGRLNEYTPGLCILAYVNGKKRVDLKLGQTWPYYDLASLTKIIFTTTTLMRLVDEERISLNEPISNFLPWWSCKKTKVIQLLNHTAGLTAWAPLYKKINKIKNLKKKREKLQELLEKVKPNPKQKKSIYSDLDFLLLGFVLEAIEKKPLDRIFEKENTRLKLKSLHFNKNNKRKYKKNLYAPTEKCPWRKKTLQGEVHDDNTWALGGVSTHAGLFGKPQDVAQFGLLLRKALKNHQGSRLCSHKTAKLFTKRSIKPAIGDFALGYMMPSKGATSAGTLMSKSSMGHTGFTGTSLWYDPIKDILIVIISNRVHPTRKNKKFVALRPKLHEAVVKHLPK